MAFEALKSALLREIASKRELARQKPYLEEDLRYKQLLGEEARARAETMFAGLKEKEEVRKARKRVGDFFANIIATPWEQLADKATEDEKDYIEKIAEMTGNNPMYVENAMNKVKFSIGLRENPDISEDISIAYPEQFSELMGVGTGKSAEEAMKVAGLGTIQYDLKKDFERFLTTEIGKRLNKEYRLKRVLAEIQSRHGRVPFKVEAALRIISNLETKRAAIKEDMVMEVLKPEVANKRMKLIEKRINEIAQFISDYEKDPNTPFPAYMLDELGDIGEIGDEDEKGEGEVGEEVEEGAKEVKKKGGKAVIPNFSPSSIDMPEDESEEAD